jgi:O-antigen/teichoic acid export membrane protein
VYSSVFTANNNLKLLCYISLAGLGINIISNIILIPSYSALGAAISNLLSFGVMALIYVISYHIKFNFKIAYGIWFKFLFLSLILCLSELFLNQLLLNWVLNLLLFLTIGLLTSFLLKLVSVKDFL